jgi:metal-responsive CopG/Arc/MetJ family transcriptional regulator
MMADRSLKLTITLPVNLVREIDNIAEEGGVSRSKVVVSCLQEFADKHLQEKMAEGYKVLAQEHAEFAEIAIKCVKIPDKSF